MHVSLEWLLAREPATQVKDALKDALPIALAEESTASPEPLLLEDAAMSREPEEVDTNKV